MFKIMRSKKGISPILATLLLIVIAVAAVIVTYAWVLTFTTTQTTSAARMIKFDSAVIDASTGNVTIYVRNKGTETVTIDKVYIDGRDFTSYTNLTTSTLSENAVVRITTTSSSSAEFSFTAGEWYKVKVTGNAEWEQDVKAT
ncbi:MAG: archaellin/type IV pilin N-terminal domain-containing protein [Candidatus Bathyarchaeia archaeon]